MIVAFDVPKVFTKIVSCVLCVKSVASHAVSLISSMYNYIVTVVLSAGALARQLDHS